jgi:Rod binding domain-containing protein
MILNLTQSAPANTEPTDPVAKAKHKELVKEVQKWVATTFYGTLLKQMRDDPFHSDLFDGGRGGQMFQGMLDQELADRMSKSSAPKLVNAIVSKIERGKAAGSYARQSDIFNKSGAAHDLSDKARAYVAPVG